MAISNIIDKCHCCLTKLCKTFYYELYKSGQARKLIPSRSHAIGNFSKLIFFVIITTWGTVECFTCCFKTFHITCDCINLNSGYYFFNQEGIEVGEKGYLVNIYSKNDGIKAVSHGLSMEKRVIKFAAIATWNVSKLKIICTFFKPKIDAFERRNKLDTDYSYCKIILLLSHKSWSACKDGAYRE